jgi:hypothetical protein
VEGGLGASTGPSASVLRHNRAGDLNWRKSQLHPARSDKGLVLERGHQWSGCGSDHGHDHVDGLATKGHGSVRVAAGAQGLRLARHSGDGCGSDRHVRDLGGLSDTNQIAISLGEGVAQLRASDQAGRRGENIGGTPPVRARCKASTSSPAFGRAAARTTPTSSAKLASLRHAMHSRSTPIRSPRRGRKAPRNWR